MSVSQDDGFYEGAVLLEVSDVGNDEVHAEEFGFGEHHSGVDDDDVVTEPQRHHVHSKFAEAAEGDSCKRLRGVTQRMVISIYSTLIVSHGDGASRMRCDAERVG